MIDLIIDERSSCSLSSLIGEHSTLWKNRRDCRDTKEAASRSRNVILYVVAQTIDWLLPAAVNRRFSMVN